jgi:hypothetical protein
MCAAGALRADEPATIDADKVSFDQPANMAYGDGNVVVKYRDATLRADHVRFNTLTKDAWAEGNVRLHRADGEWAVPAARYNFETGAFETRDVRAFLDPVIVRATEVAQISSNCFAFRSATLTTCDYDRPHYRLEATRGEIWPGDRIVFRNVTLRLGNIPVFWFPVLSFPLGGDAAPLEVSVGGSSRSGFFFLLGPTWRLNPHADLALHLDEREKRGPGIGADLKYRFSASATGLLRGYYINDNEPVDDFDVAAGKDIPYNRYRLQWQHKQFAGDFAFTVDLHKLSDPDVVDDFFHNQFRQEREPSSVADVTRRGPNHTLSLLARPQFNDFFGEVERLPELKLAVNRTRLWRSPVFYEAQSSAGYYHNEPGSVLVVDTNAAPALTGRAVRADTFHQLVAPATLGGWLAVVPRAGVRGTFYDNSPAGSDLWRVAYDLGCETSFKLTRTWPDVRSSRLAIDGLRHVVEPFADYQWVPEPNRLPGELYQFDSVRSVRLAGGDALALTRYSPLEFPAFNAVDAIGRQHVARFGLRQKLQTRRDKRPWDLAELEGWTDYRIQQDAGQSDFSDIFCAARLRPWDWIAVGAFSRYDADAGQLRELNAEGRVADPDRWSVGLGTRFLKDDSNLVSASLAWRLNRHWAAQVYQRVDLRDGAWESQEYVLRQETHDWLISYGLRYRSERVRDDEIAVFFAVALKAYPNIELGVSGIDVSSGD